MPHPKRRARDCGAPQSENPAHEAGAPLENPGFGEVCPFEVSKWMRKIKKEAFRITIFSAQCDGCRGPQNCTRNLGKVGPGQPRWTQKVPGQGWLFAWFGLCGGAYPSISFSILLLPSGVHLVFIRYRSAPFPCTLPHLSSS